jgi:hypothetical protein
MLLEHDGYLDPDLPDTPGSVLARMKQGIFIPHSYGWGAGANDKPDVSVEEEQGWFNCISALSDHFKVHVSHPN